MPPIKRNGLSPEPTFDSLLARQLAELKATKEYREAQIARHAAWKQTHRAGTEGEPAWVAL